MERRTLLKAGLATTAGGLLVPMVDGLTVAADARPRVAKMLARDLRTPWGIAFLPGGSALVGERDSGLVYRVGKRGGRRRVGRVRVHSQRAAGGEGGLLGLALHPEFRRNHWLYAYLSTRDDNRIVRLRYHDGSLGRPHVVLAGIPTGVHHNGGRLAFGPDGLLYASTGDAEHPTRAQNRRSLGGKILRLTPEGDVPRGNPFGNHTWSYGHRNVEGLAFDSRGRLWASEFGEKDVDELNRIRRGGNYGWPFEEGGDGRGGYRDPLATWQTENCSPSGIAVARGHAFLGALRGRCLWSVRLDGPRRGRRRRYFTGDLGRIRTVQAAPDGSLWITTSNHDGRSSTAHPNDDRVLRVRLS
ncbi:MAG TPA: PQQ-dependent sugar dehydrogenase [Nocardioidaceae bacterium]|nr:PQQ-dependent sugar dehydrogenase [Nocardioidaceae bacterium]